LKIRRRRRFGPVRTALVLTVLVGAGAAALTVQHTTQIQFVFTSDAHYGLTRPAFRGGSNVSAHIVNAAMVARINALPGATFPSDNGLKAGQTVGPLDFVAEGGDIANREETPEGDRIQRAATSWAQFRTDYIDGLTLADRSGQRAPVYTVPGNHDASNAIGFYKPMTPPIDKTAMIEIYNRMMAPATPKSTATYDYARDKVLVSHDLGGIHFVYLTIWPDTVSRAWMDADLSRVLPSTPVIIFTHDQPDAESKHFTNPNGKHDINPIDKFENLLSDRLADGSTVDAPDTIEQRAFEGFVKRHANLVAYFHGNSNWNEFYDWTGPGHTIVLHTFRVDSPMKGASSATDETMLSFHVVTIDTAVGRMTVRECLWDADPRRLVWGASRTIVLVPRPTTN
jgi:hypothetical protein